jgi:hypothetical protein
MPADAASDEGAEQAEAHSSAPREPQHQPERAGAAEQAPAAAAAGPRLDVRKLEGVINELAACRALLDAALGERA